MKVLLHFYSIGKAQKVLKQHFYYSAYSGRIKLVLPPAAQLSIFYCKINCVALPQGAYDTLMRDRDGERQIREESPAASRI